MSKGSQRRPGQGYDEAFEKVFGKRPQSITKPVVEADADWWLECPDCGKVHPRGVSMHPFCISCPATALELHTDAPLPEPELEQVFVKPVTPLDRKRARFVGIHSKDKE